MKNSKTTAPAALPPDSGTICAQLAAAAPQVGRFEAALLLAYALGRTREYLIAHDDEAISPADALRYQMLVNMRVAGTPIPYITGSQEFYGRHFTVNENVLIPRPDTEVLIEQALLVAPERPAILDLGTGSGCIGITLALEIPGSRVTATDSSKGALDVAKKNAEALGAAIDFRLGIWWDALEEGERFDVIASNPPYIRPDDEHLAALANEPLGALTDGIDGLQCLRDIAGGAMARLAPGGWLLLEHGYDQGADVRAMLEAAGFAAVRTKKDYGGNERVTLGRRAD